jgi:hypothetical protein
MGMQITGTWLAFATAHQGALPLDALGQHLYIDQNLPTTYANVSAYLGWIHEVAMQFGKQLPTYVTEAAWSTRSLPQPVQAANLDTLFQAAKQSGYVPMTTWFELTDVPQSGLYFGLQDRTGTNKLSYSHYQSQAGATPAPASTPTGGGGYSSPTPQPPDSGSATPPPSPVGGTPIAWPTSPPMPGDTPVSTGTATEGSQPSSTPTITPSASASATASASILASGTPTATPIPGASLP